MATSTSGNTWTPEVELALFLAMVGLRPVGIHRHFRLINIYTRMVSRIGGADLTLGDIKRHLDRLYNIKLLEEIEAEEDESSSQNTNPEKAATKSGAKVNSRAHEETDGGGGDGDDESIKRRETLFQPMVAHNAVASVAGITDVSDPQFWRKGDAEFALPWAEFGALMVERAGAGNADEDAEASSIGMSPISTPREATREATPEPTPEPASSDGHVSPVQKRRRGRSATPVPRSRTKAPVAAPVPAPTVATTRSAAPSTRKRPKKH
ncbi:hypothetical protein IWW57_001174 [Coemansia sp. S610]|nr:hypothetical protein IWW57_001174 [Coemansia sp. S610]KAJ2373787.1 hypothetical protein H4S02_008746 [Coemansia sp. RSA 2611]